MLKGRKKKDTNKWKFNPFPDRFEDRIAFETDLEFIHQMSLSPIIR